MFPPAWLAILPGNLLVDGLVLFLSPTALKCADRKARIRRLILPFWICGFLADFAGTAWMYPGIFVSGLSGSRNLYRPFSQISDFFSIGTNDLVQYTMAADRGNPKVGYLNRPMHPAVLRSVRHIIACGKKAGIPVGMCGEAAADPLLTPLLLA